MTVWIHFRIAKQRCHSVLETLGNEVLQSFGFLMHLIPGVLEHVVKEQFQQTMVPHEFPGAALPC